MPLETITRGTILVNATRLAGALEATGTADAGAAGTLDDNILTHPNTDQLRNFNLYIYNGVAQGDDRIVSAFTPGSDRLTVVPNFSATPTTTSQYILLRPPWRIQQFIDGVQAASRYCRDNGIVPWKHNTELVTGDLLMGQGNFERWPSGAAAAPAGWVAGANTTIARRTGETFPDNQYHVRLTSDGTLAASMTYAVPNFFAYRGAVVDLRGYIQTSVASRVTMTVDDGTTTNTSTAITALNSFRDSEFTGGPAVALLTVGDNPTRLRVSLLISAGSAVDADFARLRLILTGKWLTEYEIPQGDEALLFKYIHHVEMGRNHIHAFTPDRVLENYFWKAQQWGIVDRNGTRQLQIPNPLPVDRPLRLYGYGAPDILDNDDDTIDNGNGTFYATFAAWYAARSQSPGVPEITQRVLDLERDWRDMAGRMESRPRAGSIRVHDT